jgi:hypothetical protein
MSLSHIYLLCNNKLKCGFKVYLGKGDSFHYYEICPSSF